VRRYLAEFLSDPRVVEIPRWLWLPLLHGIILNVRPRQSAAKYASIWTDEGSPLRVHSEHQTKLLRGLLGHQGIDIDVGLGMRYGEPSIGTALRALREQGAERIIVLPLYPQYAASTTATAFDAVARELAGWRELPELTFVRSFHDDPGYVDALAARVERHWSAEGRPSVLLMSFHGVPQRTLDEGDPYHCHSHKTARLLAERLGLAKAEYRVTFQSRFGRAKWLEPSTSQVIEELGRARTARVDVVCPGFVADCLETLEEIAIEGRHAFLAAGGGGFSYIPCLNDDPALIAALARIVRDRLGAADASGRNTTEALSRQRQLAAALGASR
jgi:ferrochelatase